MRDLSIAYVPKTKTKTKKKNKRKKRKKYVIFRAPGRNKVALMEKSQIHKRSENLIN